VIPSVLLRPDARTKEDLQNLGAWYKNIITIYALPTTLVNFFMSVASSLYVSYLLDHGRVNGIDNMNIFFMVTAITLMVSRPFSGYLTDRFGLKKVVIPGMCLIITSFLVVGYSKTLTPILFAAVLSALGTAATTPALQAMCMQSVPPLKRSVASNTLYIGIDLALFTGPLYGSIIYKHTNYSTMFKFGVLPVVLGLVCFIIVLPIYQRRRQELEQAGKELE
jgi:MFS family permease